MKWRLSLLTTLFPWLTLENLIWAICQITLLWMMQLTIAMENHWMCAQICVTQRAFICHGTKLLQWPSLGIWVSYPNILQFFLWLLTQWETIFCTLVGNVADISATCRPDTCRSRIFDDIFNVADTVTGSQSWSRVGKKPRHDICEASAKLACREIMSSSWLVRLVMSPTCHQTSSWHVATLWWWHDMSPKMGARRHDTTPTFPTKQARQEVQVPVKALDSPH